MGNSIIPPPSALAACLFLQCRCNIIFHPFSDMSEDFCRPSSEKVPQFCFILSGKDSEAGKWAACIAVERWGNPPDAATSTTQFLFLLGGILFKSIRRIGDHGMN